MSALTVGLVQQAGTSDYEASLARSAAGVREAASRGARVVLLQELHTSLYFCQTEDVGRFDLAEPIPGPSTERLGALARETGVVLVGSLFERRAPGRHHHTPVVFERDGRLLGRYRKMHIPDDPGYYEKFYFAPGDLGFAPIETSAGRLGVLVCWDQWFPEAARLAAMKGADVLLYPTAIGWDPRDGEPERARQLDAWTTIQRAHAIANGLPVVVAHRVGVESDPGGASPGIQFWGASFVAGPQGEILARAGHEHPEVLVQEIDRTRCEYVRRIWPFLRDRRIEAYGDLLKRYAD